MTLDEAKALKINSDKVLYQGRQIKLGRFLGIAYPPAGQAIKNLRASEDGQDRLWPIEKCRKWEGTQ